jgi:membrane protein
VRVVDGRGAVRRLFGLLSVFPSLAAAVALYGLIASPEQISAQVQAFSGLLPEAA